jgi:hypothetical protein
MSQGVFAPGSLGRPRAIPGVLAFGLVLPLPVVVLEGLRRPVDAGSFGGEPPPGGVAVG